MEFTKPLYTVTDKITDKTCIVVYSHDSGTDTWLAANKVLAEQSVYRTMLDWIDDLDGDDAKEALLQKISGNKFVEACNFWGECTQESFELDGSTFILTEDMSKELADTVAAIRKSMFDAHLEEEEP